MAEIFLARQNSTDDSEGDDSEGDVEAPELVVIKRVLPHLVEESRFIAMFRDEARLASQIIHPNVCRVFDSGRVQGTHFMAMEYLHGVPLSRMLMRAARTKQHLSVPLVVGVLMQCCDGLHHAHELKSRDGRSLEVVHRDVSPPNIFVTADGLAKMLDFGVAKARGATQKTRTGTVKGKNSYMSPEQILGQDVDRRSDVFSLGIVLWEALAAQRLFSRDTDFLTFTAITKAEIPEVRKIRPEITDALAAVVNKALAQDREDRYESAKELCLALCRANEGEEEYASKIDIGEFVRLRFSTELVSKIDLTRRISQELKTVSEPMEGDELPSGDEPSGADDTARSARPGAKTMPMPVAGQEDPPHQPTDTQMLLINPPRERRRLVFAVVLAAAVTAFTAGRFFGGSETEKAPDLATTEPALVLVPVAVDASVPMLVPVAIDAAVPDATPAAVVPKEDRRPAFLTVDSSPYATIFVDGKKLGVTPIFKVKLKPGMHKMKAVSATGAKQTIRLNLKPGRTKNLGRLKW